MSSAIDAVTPNRAETARATGRPINTAADAFTAGKRLCLQLQLDYCFVTLDSDGIAIENLQLSNNRAEAVRGALIERGIDAGVYDIDPAEYFL